MFKTFSQKVAVALALASVATAPAFAVAPDFSTITAAVDWSTVGVGILAIGALMAVPLVVRKGAKMVLSMIR